MFFYIKKKVQMTEEPPVILGVIMWIYIIIVLLQLLHYSTLFVLIGINELHKPLMTYPYPISSGMLNFSTLVIPLLWIASYLVDFEGMRMRLGEQLAQLAQ